jgi:hypothetical protein
LFNRISLLNLFYFIQTFSFWNRGISSYLRSSRQTALACSSASWEINPILYVLLEAAEVLFVLEPELAGVHHAVSVVGLDFAMARDAGGDFLRCSNSLDLLLLFLF